MLLKPSQLLHPVNYVAPTTQVQVPVESEKSESFGDDFAKEMNGMAAPETVPSDGVMHLMHHPRLNIKGTIRVLRYEQAT